MSRHRTSLFGTGRPVPLDRNAKTRVEHLALALSGHRAKGEAYGHGITPKVLDVLHELMWTFHNAKTGLCYPSYETLAKAAGCARSTVAAAIQALERAGVISWVHRLVRIRKDGIVRAVRTSNGYQLHDPKPPQVGEVPSKSDRRTGTTSQALSPSFAAAAPIETDRSLRWKALGAALG